MAKFCSQCGGPVGENVAFCRQCGSRQGGERPVSRPAMPYSSASPPVPPRNNNALLKLVGIGLICLVGLVSLVSVGVWYAAHKVKQVAMAKVHEYGLNRDSDSVAVPRHIALCGLLSKTEASKLLGEPVERAEEGENECSYYAPPGVQEKLARSQMSDLVKQSHKPGASIGAADVADAVTNLAGSFMGNQENSKSSGRETPLLIILVANDGKVQMTALRGSKAFIDAFDLKGGSEEIPDLGDRAFRVGNLGLNVLQGDTLLRIIPGPVPGAHKKCVAIAREILPRL